MQGYRYSFATSRVRQPPSLLLYKRTLTIVTVWKTEEVTDLSGPSASLCCDRKLQIHCVDVYSMLDAELS